MTLNPRIEMERSIAIGVIGNSTIAKQFLDYYVDIHPDFRSNDAIREYNQLKADIIDRYTSGAGSTEIVKELYRRYDIKVTTHTFIVWLRSLGVTIRPPTRERERVIRTKWERERVREIQRLKEELESLENTHSTTIDELMICKSTLRMCVSEKESLERKLARREEEIKEIMIKG